VTRGDSPVGVSDTATKVDRNNAADSARKKAVNRYGVVNALVAAGIDAAAIDVYYDDEEHGVYWVVAAEGGRGAVLTDDTEDYVGWIEGPWPFVARLSGPDGVVEVVDYSIDELVAKTIAWCAGG